MVSDLILNGAKVNNEARSVGVETGTWNVKTLTKISRELMDENNLHYMFARMQNTWQKG